MEIAQRLDLVVLTIQDLVEYRMKHEGVRTSELQR